MLEIRICAGLIMFVGDFAMGEIIINLEENDLLNNQKKKERKS